MARRLTSNEGFDWKAHALSGLGERGEVVYEGDDLLVIRHPMFATVDDSRSSYTFYQRPTGGGWQSSTGPYTATSLAEAAAMHLAAFAPVPGSIPDDIKEELQGLSRSASRRSARRLSARRRIAQGKPDVACSDCGKMISPMEVFPKGRCVDCHAESPEGQRMVSADELTEMWGGPARRSARRVTARLPLEDLLEGYSSIGDAFRAERDAYYKAKAEGRWEDAEVHAERAQDLRQHGYDERKGEAEFWEGTPKMLRDNYNASRRSARQVTAFGYEDDYGHDNSEGGLTPYGDLIETGPQASQYDDGYARGANTPFDEAANVIQQAERALASGDSDFWRGVRDGAEDRIAMGHDPNSITGSRRTASIADRVSVGSIVVSPDGLLCVVLDTNGGWGDAQFTLRCIEGDRGYPYLSASMQEPGWSFISA